MAVEFLVDAASSSTVTGRVMAGTVRVDDVFTEAASDRTWPVALRVVEVRRYEKMLDEVETVHTARLLLDGQGWDAVAAGVTLRHGR